MFNTLFRSLLLLVCAMSLMSFTVVIDAGHGGNDAGAIGLVKGVKEKDLNLNVAQRLATKIRQQCPEVKVVMTRDTDVFLPLQQRADIANKNHADLFISIHTNAAENRNAQGAETFILGTDRMEDNLDVAMRENAVMKLEDDQTVYQGFDPNSIESYIIFELMQDHNMESSVKLAGLIQKQFRTTAKRIDKGVHQAGFLVLRATSMPSVLVELGYLNNPNDAAFLTTTSGVNALAKSIYNAFVAYYKK